MPDLDLCYLTAGEALRRFAAKSLSPVELMKAVIARAEAVEPAINAFTFKYYDEALPEGPGRRSALDEGRAAGATRRDCDGSEGRKFDRRLPDHQRL